MSSVSTPPSIQNGRLTSAPSRWSISAREKPNSAPNHRHVGSEQVLVGKQQPDNQHKQHLGHPRPGHTTHPLHAITKSGAARCEITATVPVVLRSEEPVRSMSVKPSRFCRCLPWFVTSLLGCLHFRPLDRPLGEELGERAGIHRPHFARIGVARRGADDYQGAAGDAWGRPDPAQRAARHGADGATLHRLVYRDISDEILRQAILTHFEREAHGADQPSRSHNRHRTWSLGH